MKYVNCLAYGIQDDNLLGVVFLDTPEFDSYHIIRECNIDCVYQLKLDVNGWHYVFLHIPPEKEGTFKYCMKRLIAIAELKYTNYAKACSTLGKIYKEYIGVKDEHI